MYDGFSFSIILLDSYDTTEDFGLWKIVDSTGRTLMPWPLPNPGSFVGS